MVKAKATGKGFLEEAGLLDMSILQLGESIESNPRLLQKMKLIFRERVWLNRRPGVGLEANSCLGYHIPIYCT